MADRPRDIPQAERSRRAVREAAAAPAPEGSREISGREVVAYLRRHPDFLDRHPEALRALGAAHRELGADVFDFQHFHIEQLRRDLARLTAEQRNLITAGRATLASQGRVHKAVLAAVAAGSFEQLLQTVTTDLAVLLDVDVVTIGVESAVPAARLGVQGIRLLPAGAIDALLGAEREVLLRADTPGEAALFGGAAGLVRAQALLRLGFGRGAPLGVLCIGTRQPDRFQPGQGTELLAFLARVVGITIAQWLTPRG
ncbi:MAG TPA: DUF484 family protein [Stellaceae bacterium]|nr:DUF484 family protein [Stellaceae bacterium]